MFSGENRVCKTRFSTERRTRLINKISDILGTSDQDRLLIRAAIRNAIPLTMIALVAVEIMIAAIYGGNGWAYLVREWVISGIITLLVATPMALYFSWQRAMLNELAFELATLAKTDQMSGLLNRTAFFEAMDKSLHTPLGGPTSGSLLYVDADHFKKLNDRFGHSVGDDAIRMIAEIINATPYEGAIAGRLGGEEFGLFLPDANLKAAVMAAENVRRRVRRLIFDKGPIRQQMSVSIGISMHQAGQPLGELIKQADERMYLAKAQGRNRVVFDSSKPVYEQTTKATKSA